MIRNIGTTVVVGASHAGVAVAAALRSRGDEGRIVMIDSDPHDPYQRPPLSKAFLAATLTERSLALRAPEFFHTRGIELVLGDRVVEADGTEGVVRTAAGREMSWDRLAITAGARTRRLDVPGHDLAGINYLRTHRHAVALREHLGTGDHVVVIGGGYVGLEAAAFARKAGKRVTVVEMAERLLARTASELVSEYFLGLHRRHGTQVELGSQVVAFSGSRGRVRGVTLSDGRTLPADVVVIGVGVTPRTELAEQLGLTLDNGIAVDAHALTSDARVVAAGDCASFPYPPLEGARVRLESVQNAADQAGVAAATLLGVDEGGYQPVPRFWSDQYHVKLQSVGLLGGVDEVAVLGHPQDDKFAVRYLREGHLVAADAVNWPAEYSTARRELAEATAAAAR